MSTDKITFLLNWHATPYHLPIFLAQAKGYDPRMCPEVCPHVSF
ncbi:hypothetical protein RSAG8_08314, partial [Rhizoctonia solani AG-8 WAC10335]